MIWIILNDRIANPTPYWYIPRETFFGKVRTCLLKNPLKKNLFKKTDSGEGNTGQIG